jgi:hypothetical protein
MATDQGNKDQALMELRNSPGAPAPLFVDQALAPGLFESYTQHVTRTAEIPGLDDPDSDRVDPTDTMTPTVPLYVYGDGPHDYISTDFDAGQVMVRDGNDKTGRVWRFSEEAFRRYVARAQGKKLPDDDEEAKGDNPIEEAVKYARRTAQKVEADQRANERAAAQPAGTTNVEKVDRPGGKPAGSKG